MMPRWTGRIFVGVLLVAVTVAMLFPLWWMLVISLESPDRAAAVAEGGGTIAVWPESIHWSNYSEALKQVGSEPWQGFLDALANSIVITVLVVVGTVLSSSLVGFAFARIRFRGRGLLFLIMLATMMLPAQVTMIPLFLVFRSLGWIDTILPLVIPAFFGSAFFIFMYRQFIAQISESLIEAARIDGYGMLGIWWRIILPMCTPVTAITAIFTFIFVWNDFLGPLIYLHSDDQSTLALALNSFRNQYGGLENVHLLMAVSVVTMIPCVVLFFAAQRAFVEGIGSGAVKG
ncbi:MAG: carbohydrate ABC transporter permease [Phycisphaerales bacterium]|nr:sugar ABC transporter ATP-binding protein [Phycisphaerae bacterium]MCH2152243.1 carbohydrate ABC transporter permease [Phycisphaerales bacterium]